MEMMSQDVKVSVDCVLDLVKDCDTAFINRLLYTLGERHGIIVVQTFSKKHLELDNLPQWVVEGAHKAISSGGHDIGDCRNEVKELVEEIMEEGENDEKEEKVECYTCSQGPSPGVEFSWGCNFDSCSRVFCDRNGGSHETSCENCHMTYCEEHMEPSAHDCEEEASEVEDE